MAVIKFVDFKNPNKFICLNQNDIVEVIVENQEDSCAYVNIRGTNELLRQITQKSALGYLYWLNLTSFKVRQEIGIVDARGVYEYHKSVNEVKGYSAIQ